MAKFKANLHKTLISKQSGEQGCKTSYEAELHTYVHHWFSRLCWITVVNKLLCPELTKTNQI